MKTVKDVSRRLSSSKKRLSHMSPSKGLKSHRERTDDNEITPEPNQEVAKHQEQDD